MISSFFQKCIAECIGTFAIVFFGCGAIVVSNLIPNSINSFGIAISFGVTVTIVIYSLGHISGAHCNPVVSLIFMIKRLLPIKYFFGYILFQCLGGITASFLHDLLFVDHSIDYGVPIPFDNSIWTAFIWEVILTFFLIFVIISVATDYRVEGQVAGLSIGLVVFLAAFIGGPINGASMNPARFLGPFFMDIDIRFMWGYLLGPVIGGLLAMFVYRWICCQKETSQRKNKCC